MSVSEPPSRFYRPRPVRWWVRAGVALTARARLLDPRALEFLLGLRALLWGAVLLTTPSTFSSAPAYHILAVLAPELVWGAASLIAGAAQLRAVWGERWHGRRRAAAGLAALWGGCALAFALAGDGPAAPVYTLMALAQVWVFLRLGWRRPWTH
jgi:hypothetical protein